jgi:hypothetical protein
MPARIIYIDDQADDGKAERYRERLARSEDIHCVLVPPPKYITGIGEIEVSDEGSIVDNPPSLFLVDQDLMSVDYYGSTLVAQIRSQFPEYPIVIITRRTVLKNLGPEKSRQLVEEMQTFDDFILKDMLDDDPTGIQKRLIALSEGFSALREIRDRTWVSLVEAMKADEEEADLLRETAPPLPKPLPKSRAVHGDEEEAQEEVPKVNWTVTGAAHWIRGVIISYPGILYDALHSATRLGISVDAFMREDVQREFEGCAYGGVFAPHDGRWWKGRLLGAAQELILEQELEGQINKTFAQAFSRKHGVDLEPATCVWDSSPSADQVCYVLQDSVKTEHSLRYYPDNRPSVMDHARVSFRAIQESDDFDDDFLDSNGRKLLAKIQDLEDPKSRAA